MGQIIQFPEAKFTDYTDQFDHWEQQTFSSLPARLKVVAENQASRWMEKNSSSNYITNAFTPEKDLDLVYPGIYIGSASSVNRENIIGNKIKVILNMAVEVDYNLRIPGVEMYKLGIQDAKLTNVGVFNKAAEIIHHAKKNNKKILVHCAAGISRSASAVISYLMLYEKIGWEQAVNMLESRRPCINPHHLLLRAIMRDFGKDFIP